MNNENNNSQDNSQAIFNLIQSIQAKMEPQNNNQKHEEITTSDSVTNNINLASLLDTFNNTNSNTQGQNDSNFFSGFDPNILFKIQKVISSMSEDDPKKTLLISLKPFLRKSRQDKLNEYISMLSIIKAIEVFSDKGSDKNV